MRVKPSRPGLLVAVPGRPRLYLHAEGEEVPRSTYWIRRLQDGDVVEAAESHPEPAPKRRGRAKPKPKPDPTLETEE